MKFQRIKVTYFFGMPEKFQRFVFLPFFKCSHYCNKKLSAISYKIYNANKIIGVYLPLKSSTSEVYKHQEILSTWNQEKITFFMIKAQNPSKNV